MPISVGAVVIGALFAAVVAAAQAPSVGGFGVRRDVTPRSASGSGEIRGRIIRADTREPLDEAKVELGSRSIPDAMSDAEGRFVFRNLPEGQYALTASKGGYVTLRFGQQPGTLANEGLTVALKDGQILEGIEIALPKGGVYAGYVTDDRGGVVAGASVWLSRWVWRNGRRHLTQANVVSDQTDDLGRFRLFGIPAGEYLLTVESVNARTTGRSRTYYPSAASPFDSEAIFVTAAEEAEVVVTLLPPQASAVISGVMTRSDGEALVEASVIATLIDSPDDWSASAKVRSDGSYEFPPFPAGDYVLQARTLTPTEQPQHAFALVTVAGSDSTVSLTLRRGASLRGRFVFDSTKPSDTKRPSSPLSIAIIPAPVAIYPATSWVTAADWTFEIDGLAGLFLLRPPTIPGWYAKSAKLNEHDVIDHPIEVSETDVNNVEILLRRTGRVRGNVIRRDVNEKLSVSVVIFAEDESKLGPHTRFLASVRGDDKRTFEVSHLPSGVYRAIAVEGLIAGEETNPTWRRSVRPFATPLTIEDGSDQAIELQSLRVDSTR